MSHKPLDRQSLKSLFRNGKRPNESNFASLIDSMLNKADDGILKNFNDGLSLSPEGKDENGKDLDRVLSFKEKIQDAIPQWGIELVNDNSQKGLGIVEPVSETESKTRMFFQKNGNIGIGTTQPNVSLEVNGILGTSGRVGTYVLSTVPADGNWHNILTNLDGCCAFEVMAQVGKEKTGKYALLHAHALSTFGKSRSKIRKTQAHYGWWWNKLSLRWVGDTYNYGLQIKTRTNYGVGQEIKFYVTKLWDNEIMLLFK